MKNSLMLLIFMLYVQILNAQNNPIFGGGNADGWSIANTAQPGSNIYNGGNADGWANTTFAQVGSNIFAGGNADGWANTNFTQIGNNIYAGGNADGWANTTFIQLGNNIFAGGDADGWANTNFAQLANNIYNGGAGDGWASRYIPLGPLPIKLNYFTAAKNSNTSALLKWQTEQELNAESFEIQNSIDAVYFKKIGSVKANGNSSLQTNYSFIDNNPNAINYYRLKQIDVDGKFIYTPVRLVNFAFLNNEQVKFYPNPTKGILTIELATNIIDEKKIVNISNATGKIIKQLKLEANANTKLEIDLSSFAKGIYFIQLTTGKINSTQRIVLQ